MLNFLRIVIAFFANALGEVKVIKNLSFTIMSILESIQDRFGKMVAKVVTLDTDVTNLGKTVATQQTQIDRLGAVKGDYTALPYDYEKDQNPNKPQAGITASDLFAYVMQKLNLVVVFGKSYQIQFSGDVSIPVTVDGVLESGDSEESLMVIVNEAGQQAYVYQSSTTNEKFKALSDQFEAASVAIKANEQDWSILQTRANLLLATGFPEIK
ncbi:MAG: hypothetical protein RLZZ628_2019 [Bacteroidota bacterium]|jgi:hypothetical protein